MSILASMSEVNVDGEQDGPVDIESLHPDEDEDDAECGPLDGVDFGPVDEDEEEARPIDQVYCTGCGRPMIIWADEPLRHSECGPCRQGLAPEWEY